MQDFDYLDKEFSRIINRYKDTHLGTVYHDAWVNQIKQINRTTSTSFASLFPMPADDIIYAELGIGVGATAYAIAKHLDGKGKIFLFDYEDSVAFVKKLLENEGFSNIYGFPCSYKKMDSYNWQLAKLIANSDALIFDYVYIDGSHTFPVDGLAFFLSDMLLKPGGYLDFDDYAWTMAGHISASIQRYMDSNTSEVQEGSFINFALEGFTPEQLRTKQVALIIESIVKKTGRYEEILRNRIFRKIRHG